MHATPRPAAQQNLAEKQLTRRASYRSCSRARSLGDAGRRRDQAIAALGAAPQQSVCWRCGGDDRIAPLREHGDLWQHWVLLDPALINPIVHPSKERAERFFRPPACCSRTGHESAVNFNRPSYRRSTAVGRVGHHNAARVLGLYRSTASMGITNEGDIILSKSISTEARPRRIERLAIDVASRDASRALLVLKAHAHRHQLFQQL
jgi:hypothetical protein